MDRLSVILSPPPLTPRDSPGLPIHPHAHLTYHSRTASCCLMSNLMSNLMYAYRLMPPLILMYLARLYPTFSLYIPPYILLYSLHCYQIPFCPSSSYPTHKFRTTLRQA